MSKKTADSVSGNGRFKREEKGMFRTGFGYDAHRLVEGRPLILGGVAVPHESGLEGHSDADALVHAVIDAILGALGMGDIGQHFPDTDPAYKDIDSISMLRKVIGWSGLEGFSLINLDSTIVAQRPKLSPYISAMRERLAEEFKVSTSRINIKAKTTEGLGFCGRQEGIEAFAVVSLKKEYEEKT